MSTSSSSPSSSGAATNSAGWCVSSGKGAARGSAGPEADSSSSMSRAGSENASSPPILDAVSTSSTVEAKTSFAGGWTEALICALAPFWLLPPPSFWLLFCLLADREFVMSPRAFRRMGVAPCCLPAVPGPPEFPSPMALPGARCWTMCWFSTSADITRSPSIPSLVHLPPACATECPPPSPHRRGQRQPPVRQPALLAALQRLRYRLP
mmetsp:Transcript_51743/g.128749  ORF Transcript_51743/g.128749 Transcript_51743/m.128749 type:complete len:209 (-) Transcript_51743:93-719(-)